MSIVAKSKFELLSVDEAQLDIGNPRIAKWLEMYGDDITAEQMSLALGAGDPSTSENQTTFRSLRESIRSNGGLIHPIIANQTKAGAKVVIEGNTRTLIYREFRDDKVPGDWKQIPAMVYDDLSSGQIDQIRLQAHLVGPREWNPYSKARYLKHLRDSQSLTFNQIVDFCGGRQREVEQYIGGYNDMEKYYRPALEADSDFDPTRFSAFAEVQNPRIREAVLKAGFGLKDFAVWVRDHLISPLTTVRQLPRILGDDESREVFLEHGTREALKVLETPTTDAVLSDASLIDLAREVTKRVAQLPFEDMQALKTEARSTHLDILSEARDFLAELCQQVSTAD